LEKSTVSNDHVVTEKEILSYVEELEKLEHEMREKKNKGEAESNECVQRRDQLYQLTKDDRCIRVKNFTGEMRTFQYTAIPELRVKVAQWLQSISFYVTLVSETGAVVRDDQKNMDDRFQGACLTAVLNYDSEQNVAEAFWYHIKMKDFGVKDRISSLLSEKAKRIIDGELLVYASYYRFENLVREVVRPECVNHRSSAIHYQDHTHLDATALGIACEKGYKEIVQILLDNKADVNFDDYYRPLERASKYGHIDLVRLLVDHKADINGGDSGSTPLMVASENGHLEIVEILLQNGAEVNLYDENNGRHNQSKALAQACENKHLPVVQILLEHGANPNYQYECHCGCVDEWSLLFCVEDIKIRNLLIQYGGVERYPHNDYNKYDNTTSNELLSDILHDGRGLQRWMAKKKEKKNINERCLTKKRDCKMNRGRKMNVETFDNKYEKEDNMSW